MSDDITMNDRLVEDSMNRAFGIIVSELRLVARGKKLRHIRECVPCERIYLLAVDMIADQFVHDERTKEPARADVDSGCLLNALHRVADKWGFALLGNDVIFKIDLS